MALWQLVVPLKLQLLPRDSKTSPSWPGRTEAAEAGAGSGAAPSAPQVRRTVLVPAGGGTGHGSLLREQPG